MVASLPPCPQSDGSASKVSDDEGDGHGRAPAMPSSFYQSVDALLSRPPPNLHGICKRGGAADSASALPTLRKQRSELRKAQSGGSAAAPQASLTTGSQPLADIDSSAVAEAMEYCENLTRTALMQWGDSNALAGGSSQRPGLPSSRETRRPPKSKPIPQRTRQLEDRGPNSRQPRRENSQRDDGGELRMSKTVPPEDVERLVKNFESGAHLQELRRQLHESQKSMQESRNFIAAAARSWHDHRAT